MSYEDNLKELKMKQNTLKLRIGMLGIQKHVLLERLTFYHTLNRVKKNFRLPHIALLMVLLSQLFLPLIIVSDTNYDLLPTYAIFIAITMPLVQIFITKIFKENETQKLEMYFEILLHRLIHEQESVEIYDDALNILHGTENVNTSFDAHKDRQRKKLEQELHELEGKIQQLKHQHQKI